MNKCIFVLLGLIARGSSISHGPTSKIIGGQNAAIGSAPYIVGVYFGYSFICGASIISPKWCLTAGHCVNGQNARNYFLVAGTNNRNGTGTHAQLREAYRFIMHPYYESETRTTAPKNDIALIQVTNAFTFNAFVRSIELPNEIATGVVQIWGWGSTANGTTTRTEPPLLQIVSVYLLPLEDCRLVVGPVMDYFLCVFPGHGACVGDSGGPMTQTRNTSGVLKVYLDGVVSYGYFPCGVANQPTFYTQVHYYKNFIESAINYYK